MVSVGGSAEIAPISMSAGWGCRQLVRSKRGIYSIPLYCYHWRYVRIISPCSLRKFEEYGQKIWNDTEGTRFYPNKTRIERGVKSMEKLKKFFKEEEGVAAVEYGILVALIASAIIPVVGTLGTTIRDKFQYIVDNLK